MYTGILKALFKLIGENILNISKKKYLWRIALIQTAGVMATLVTVGNLLVNPSLAILIWLVLAVWLSLTGIRLHQGRAVNVVAVDVATVVSLLIIALAIFIVTGLAS